MTWLDVSKTCPGVEHDKVYGLPGITVEIDAEGYGNCPMCGKRHLLREPAPNLGKERIEQAARVGVAAYMASRPRVIEPDGEFLHPRSKPPVRG